MFCCKLVAFAIFTENSRQICTMSESGCVCRSHWRLDSGSRGIFLFSGSWNILPNSQIFREVLVLALMFERYLKYCPFSFMECLELLKCHNFHMKTMPTEIPKSTKHSRTSEKKFSVICILQVYLNFDAIKKLKHGLYLRFHPKAKDTKPMPLQYSVPPTQVVQAFWFKLEFLIFKTHLDIPPWAH